MMTNPVRTGTHDGDLTLDLGCGHERRLTIEEVQVLAAACEAHLAAHLLHSKTIVLTEAQERILATVGPQHVEPTC